MKTYWQNNIISKRLNEDFPHDFSICDIDGVCRCGYKDKNGKQKIRLIIYECKYENEKESKTQMDTLNFLKEFIDWSKFDSKSGVCLLRVMDENADNLKIYSFKRNGIKYEKKFLRDLTIKDFYNLISVKNR